MLSGFEICAKYYAQNTSWIMRDAISIIIIIIFKTFSYNTFATILSTTLTNIRTDIFSDSSQTVKDYNLLYTL